MPRPRKGRRVCCLPPHTLFGPLHAPPHGEVVMTVDEYESIRLLDLEGLTQEEAAQRMDVARTTVQRIYAAARHKVAQALYEGAVLRIEGGDYELYPPDQAAYGCGRCRRQRRGLGGRPGRHDM